MKIKRIDLIAAAIALSTFPLAAGAASLFPGLDNLGLSNKPIIEIIANLTKWLLGIFGFLAVISFLIAGIMYFISAGDETAQERAKKAVVYAIIGVVVGLGGMVVISAVQTAIGGSSNI
jgi:hypothetical protein